MICSNHWFIQEQIITAVFFTEMQIRCRDAKPPPPPTKEESRRVYNCDDERISGSAKHWIFKIMRNI